MLRSTLLAALVCVAVWASGHRSDAVGAPSWIHGAVRGAVADSAGQPAHATDVWESARAVVTVPTWRLDGHHADLPAAAPGRASRIKPASSSAARRPPPAPAHTFDLPLLV